METRDLATGAASRIFVLADDLTGANDTAIQFVKGNLSALVITDIAETDGFAFNNYDVVAVNSNSRGMSPQDAYKTIYGTITKFKPNEKGYFLYKKIDSVLRGNPGQELAAVMNALHIPLALAAPSFPANRSIIENGRLFSGGNSNSGGIDAIKIFADQTGKKTKSIPLEEIRQGANNVAKFINTRNKDVTQVFVADAITDNDLEIIREASSLLPSHIMAGSAGLANQLARHQGKPGAVSFIKPEVLSPVLIIAGTRQGETASQINLLSKMFQIPVIKYDVHLAANNELEKANNKAYDEVSQYMGKNAHLCVIAVESMFASTARDYAEGDDAGIAISAGLGILSKKIMDAFHFPVILSTGGDTSLGICKQLGIKAIEPLAEICPGIPLGRITGGVYDGRFIITKSGRFGNPDSIVKILYYLGVNV